MKEKTVFFCTECGYESSKWMGKCMGCGAWNSMVEQKVSKSTKASVVTSAAPASRPKKLKDVSITAEERFTTGISEFDRVLGGGVVRGSLVLIGGAPGIGKSTLSLQMCRTISEDKIILYVSAEESQAQIKMRADRLGVASDNILLYSETNLDEIEATINEVSPSVVIIDSVQTVYRPELTSASGSVSQVREATMTLMKIAKENNISVFLVGHVTKDGNLAGPRVLEHMVDCVLYFEGQQHQQHRILRAVKNRFGSTNEIGVFEMRDKGLSEVLNPSELMLGERQDNMQGSCVICSMEGTRPILVEVQALVTKTAFPVPRRMSTGVDFNRVALIMAVLEKRVKLNLGTQDGYVNVTGGMRIDEPAADLGIALAIASSFKGFEIPKTTAVIGEIGLTGEVRAVNFAERRISEAVKLGFDRIVISVWNKTAVKPISGVKIEFVSSVAEAIALFK